MTIEAKTAMAPTERSTPAVRMMIVWPMASVPTTVTCWMIRDRLDAFRNRSGDDEAEGRHHHDAGR